MAKVTFYLRSHAKWPGDKNLPDAAFGDQRLSTILNCKQQRIEPYSCVNTWVLRIILWIRGFRFGRRHWWGDLAADQLRFTFALSSCSPLDDFRLRLHALHDIFQKGVYVEHWGFSLFHNSHWVVIKSLKFVLNTSRPLLFKKILRSNYILIWGVLDPRTIIQLYHINW